jgi:hypothetical protein
MKHCQPRISNDFKYLNPVEGSNPDPESLNEVKLLIYRLKWVEKDQN